MRIFTLLLLFLAGVLTLQVSPNAASTAQASEVPFCISNEKEFLAKKNELPEALRGIESSRNGKMYKITGFKSNFASAAIKFRIADNKKLIFDVAVASPDLLFVFEDQYIKEVCYDGKNLNIQLENGTKYTAKVLANDSFELKGASFKVTTDAEYAKEVNTVRSKLNNMGKGTRPIATEGTN